MSEALQNITRKIMAQTSLLLQIEFSRNFNLKIEENNLEKFWVVWKFRDYVENRVTEILFCFQFVLAKQ